MRILVLFCLVFLYSCSKSIKRDTAQVATNELKEVEIEDPFFSENLSLNEEGPVEVKRLPTNVESKKEDYLVQEGDTLMLISFKIYGHHKRWREILGLNRSKIPDYNNLVAGTKLTFVPPENPPIIPEGTPYLILDGDTLSKISKKVYGTLHRWRDIYENNRSHIDNPNLIFSGFTLWYKKLKSLAYSFRDKSRSQDFDHK